MADSSPRVRFAPSPTGPLHMGGVRTALYNYLFARKHGGTFILRIEDTDQTRFVQGAEQYIIESLDWCGLTPDEGPGIGGEFGPYRQSERKGIYREFADKLLESGHAYYAFDSADALSEARCASEANGDTFKYDAQSRGNMVNGLTLTEEEVAQKVAAGDAYVIRFKMPENEDVVVQDAIRGTVTVNSRELDDKILFKSDGMPTYHLANIVDDHLMEITHVIRGEEWLPSAPLHVLLYQSLGWGDSMPTFAHLPLILKPSGNGKLSKRDGDKGGFPIFPLEWKADATAEPFMGYREGGYFPEAFVNMLAFLGWNPGTEQELFSLEELVADFSLERVTKAGARFDPDKTRWFNQQWLWRQNDADLAAALRPHLASRGVSAEGKDLEMVARLMKERVNFVAELFDAARYFFIAPQLYDEKTVRKRWKENSPAILQALVDRFKGLEEFSRDVVEASFKSYLEENELGFGAGAVPLRLSLTGTAGGPDLFDIVAFLGRDEVLNRMEAGVQRIAQQAQV